jgi:MoxR-like ATPase|tara:strand:+ start:3830 stop:5068 length:1239 start_codon:yes stop_codon:yes gene_type:complete
MSVKQKEQFLQALADVNNSASAVFSKAEAMQIAKSNGLKNPMWFFKECKVGRNQFSPNMATLMTVGNTALKPVADEAPALEETVSTLEPIETIQSQALDAKIVKQAKLAVEIENLVPDSDSTYVPFGFHKDLVNIIKSGMFYPTFICGLSGNGKTMMVEQVCAKLKKEAIRVNISIETDEDDLIGGNTLVDGNVVYREGPVLTAMKRGAILILDEIDRGSNKLMCLQAILEGKPYFNKKSGEVVTPATGFNVIATANTKGRGSDDGKFMGAQVLDEAFLERFAITVEQEYPSSVQEKKIVMNKMGVAECVDEDFADKLVMWADIIRKTFYEGGIDELVSTRRLEHIVKAYAMFSDRLKAIQLCVNRFDTDTKSAFIDLYTKVDAGATVEEIMDNPTDGSETETSEENDSYDF